jgi:hypothetical protein
MGVYTPDELAEKEVNPNLRPEKPTVSAFDAMTTKQKGKPKKSQEQAIEGEFKEVIPPLDEQPERSNGFEAYMIALDDCSSIEELAEVAKDLAVSDLPEDEKNDLRKRYTERKKQIEGAA